MNTFYGYATCSASNRSHVGISAVSQADANRIARQYASQCGGCS